MGKLLAIIEAVLERSFILGETKEAQWVMRCQSKTCGGLHFGAKTERATARSRDCL